MKGLNQNKISRPFTHECKTPSWPDKDEPMVPGTRYYAADFNSDIAEGSRWQCECGQVWECTRSGRYAHGTPTMKLRPPKWKKVSS